MHYIAAQPGMLDGERELTLIAQSRGEVVFLSAADTDLACAAQQWKEFLGQRLRIAHAGPLRQPVSVDDYIEKVLSHARLVVAKLLGGRAYFPNLISSLEVLRENQNRPLLLILGGAEALDEELAELNDFSLETSRTMFTYFREGGIENFRMAGDALNRLTQARNVHLAPAVVMPECGWHRPSPTSARLRAWVLFYRAWQQTGDMAVVDPLIDALHAQGFDAEGFYAHSLRSEIAQHELASRTADFAPDVIITMQSFALGGGGENESFLDQFDCPVLQIPVSSTSQARWRESAAGLSPAETAMNVVLPEVDGRIFGTVAGFKEEALFDPDAEWTIKKLVPEPEQIARVALMARNWADLRRKKNHGKKVAIVLSNYPNRDGRIGNGVGLDTPASAVELLRALKGDGYDVSPMPSDGEELMNWLQEGPTNDDEQSQGKVGRQSFSRQRTNDFIAQLSGKRCEEMSRHWGQRLQERTDCEIAGLQLGNVFVGIQPPRGFSLQTAAIYHSPDLPPPPEYLAFYLWLREEFHADAIVHLGKHGNLEWLPGRSVALGGDDYPSLILESIPHLYPFIVNNPGEGAQAKRRTSAVIVDHLTPPLTRAGLYADLEKIERLMEERAHAELLYPVRAEELKRDIEKLLDSVSWKNELPRGENILSSLGQYLCEIKESQIRSGLHVLGRKPDGEKETDFLLSLLRCPIGERPGLIEALHGGGVSDLSVSQRDAIEKRARDWISADGGKTNISSEKEPHLAAMQKTLREELRPKLCRCEDEIENLLRGLAGKRVPPGPAGAPTRGRLDVLPTGRNFFAVDPRIIPTPTAWRCGRRVGELLLERHRQEQGEYPRTIALVIWGTSNMRTGGDDIAQALWLWGCEPVWEENSGRVIDFKIIPAHLLGRPRVDLTLRVSGLFRDAFGESLRLLAAVPKRLAQLDEPAELNPIRAAYLRDEIMLREQGIESIEATRRASLRVFSSGPGCYGTGLLPLIDAGNWETKQDITDVFCKWGSHAYDHEGATDAPDLLRRRLSEVEVVHQNQDNREHDILDSDDYFQFQGGLQAAVQAIRGIAPANYHGDSSRPDEPKVRLLKEELIRVLRSRVLNPRWLTAMREHGYKGAAEMAATIDYMFGYSATTDMISDHQFADVAQTVLLDPVQREFFERHNRAALAEATERMLEARARGLWRAPKPDTIAALEEMLLELKGTME
jgi:cobaltochelatase CobN